MKNKINIIIVKKNQEILFLLSYQNKNDFICQSFIHNNYYKNKY